MNGYYLFWYLLSLLTKSLHSVNDFDFEKVANRSFSKKLPYTSNDETVKVLVGIYIESLNGFEALNMAYEADMYLRLSWKDTRLAHNFTDVTINDLESLKQIWVPDIYFGNAKKASFQDVTVPNFVLYVESDGTCSYSARVTMTVACNLDLKDYPMDAQICSLIIQSYAHDLSRMNVTWFGKSPIQINDRIDLAEFEILHIEPCLCKGVYEYALTERSSRIGEFSCLEAKIHLKRSIGYHLVQTYIPTGLIVMISWVSFWIEGGAVPARVSLSFTTLLTLSTIGAGLRFSLPPVSYAKAIDFWLGMCMLFVFGALVQFAIVNSFIRMSIEAQHNRPNVGFSDNKNDISFEDEVSNGRRMTLTGSSASYAIKALLIDKSCRVLFPLCFLVFNLFYWIYYLH